MATQPAATPAADPSMSGADPSAAGDDDSSSGGYTIEINVAGDGSITVEVESADAESAEGSSDGSGSDDDSGAQPAANIKEALTLALGAYKNNGVLPDAKGAQDDFDQGYGSGPGGAAAASGAASGSMS